MKEDLRRSCLGRNRGSEFRSYTIGFLAFLVLRVVILKGSVRKTPCDRTHVEGFLLRERQWEMGEGRLETGLWLQQQQKRNEEWER